ncbi:MAG TPA: hypothetical protein VMT03_02135 [Polyangia bacterium]|nr:hypothetical protein [Polyangia bacterium]
MNQSTTDIETETEIDPRREDLALARELCALATWCHALGDTEKRDTAITLAADVLGDDPVLVLEGAFR